MARRQARTTCSQVGYPQAMIQPTTITAMTYACVTSDRDQSIDATLKEMLE